MSERASVINSRILPPVSCYDQRRAISPRAECLASTLTAVRRAAVVQMGVGVEREEERKRSDDGERERLRNIGAIPREHFSQGLEGKYCPLKMVKNFQKKRSSSFINLKV